MKAIHSTIAALCATIFVACGNAPQAQEHNSPIAAKPKGAIRIMSYNVGAIGKFVDDNFTKEDNAKLISDIIIESQSDAVAIQELDSCNARNNYFQLKTVAEGCGKDWDHFYGPAINYRGGKYGTGVTAKGQKAIKTLYIPVPVQEKREARVLTIAEYKNYVIACTHLNGGDPEQVKFINTEIKKLYGDSKKPVFLGGDMNAFPDSDMINEFRKEWTIISQTAEGTTVVTVGKPCIDYVLQLNNKAKPVTVLDSKVIREANSGDMKKASDHYAVYVDVKL